MDNTRLSPGRPTGDLIRSLEKGEVKTQVVALDLGGSGAEQLAAGAIPVTGSFYPPTQPVSIAGSVAVTGTFYPGTQPVSGTFWQATQPVSIASMPSTPVTGTFWQATQPISGSVTVSSAPTTAVTGTFWQATQPVSGTVTANAGTNLNTSTLALDTSLTGHAQTFKAANLAVTTLSAANATVTATLAAVASQFHYITRIRITMHNTSAAAVAGSAVTLAFTSTNLPGSLAWTEGNALAAGASKTVVDEVLSQPLKSSAVNTASTIVAPACGAGVLVRITVYYYTAA